RWRSTCAASSPSSTCPRAPRTTGACWRSSATSSIADDPSLMRWRLARAAAAWRLMQIVGRAREQARLTEVVAAGGALAIRGMAGSGKSTLRAWAASLGRARGLRVIETAAVAAERALPLAGIEPVVRALGGTLDAAAPTLQAALALRALLGRT